MNINLDLKRIITFGFLGLASPVLFAEANQENEQSNAQNNDENIIRVVARQRQENIQNVPIAMTVFGGTDIEDLGIERAQDFISMTPNMTMAETQNAGSSFITIRGLSQVRNGESPVAVAIDGVLQISPNQFNQELFDIEQIEILKGPQGALYGRNAIGGAINITTKKPAEITTGSVEFDIGNGSSAGLTAAVSGPLSDSLSYSLSVLSKETDGFIDNVTLNKPADPLKDTSFRGRVIYKASDDFSLDARFLTGKTEGGALNFVYQPLFGINDADDASVDVQANNPGENDREISQFSVTADYQLENSNMLFIVARDTLEEFFAGDQFPYSAAISANSPFGTNVLDGIQTQYLDVSATSYELRFTSDSDQDLRWIVGAYMLNTERYLSSSTSFDMGQGMLRVERTPFSNNVTNPTNFFAADDNDNNAYAVFTQLNYDVNDKSELTFSVRYDKDEREQSNRSVAPFTANAGEVRSADFSKVQPKLSYTYKASDNWTYYGSFAEGFRSGGFNQSGMGALASTVGLFGVEDIYKAEETQNFELGVKGRLSDSNTRINISLFNNTVDNQHYFVFVGALGAQVLTNIDEVSLTGGEFEIITSTDNIDAYFSFGITDSEINDFALDSTVVGNEAPYIADYTINAGIQYNTEIATWLGFARLDLERRGPQFWDHLNSTERSALNLINFRIGAISPDDEWSVSLWGKNLSDEEYNSEWVLGGFAHRALPRTYGIEIRRNFE